MTMFLNVKTIENVVFFLNRLINSTFNRLSEIDT